MEMDRGARTQKEQAYRAADLLSRSLCVRTSAMRTYINKARRQARRLYVKSWKQTWRIPRELLFCETSPLCVAVNHLSSISAYQVTAKKLNKLIRQILSRVNRRECPPRPTPTPCICKPEDEAAGKCTAAALIAPAGGDTIRSLRAESKRVYQHILEMSASLPTYTDRCE